MGCVKCTPAYPNACMDTLEGFMLVLLHLPALKTYWQHRRDLSLAKGFRRTGVSRGQLARVVC